MTDTCTALSLQELIKLMWAFVFMGKCVSITVKGSSMLSHTAPLAHSHPSRPSSNSAPDTAAHAAPSSGAAEACARKGKSSGQCIRLNKPPEEAIKQASKTQCAARPESQSRM